MGQTSLAVRAVPRRTTAGPPGRLRCLRSRRFCRIPDHQLEFGLSTLPRGWDPRDPGLQRTPALPAQRYRDPPHGRGGAGGLGPFERCGDRGGHVTGLRAGATPLCSPRLRPRRKGTHQPRTRRPTRKYRPARRWARPLPDQRVDRRITTRETRNPAWRGRGSKPRRLGVGTVPCRGVQPRLQAARPCG